MSRRRIATTNGWCYRRFIRPKGLEWQCVFVIWVVDGKFPSIYSFVTDEELEEERRLFYVAVTRAKRHLYLTYPINVFDKSSGMLLSKPTRFLDHVSPAMFDQLALVEEGSHADWRGYWDDPLLNPSRRRLTSRSDSQCQCGSSCLAAGLVLLCVSAPRAGRGRGADASAAVEAISGNKSLLRPKAWDCPQSSSKAVPARLRAV